MHAGVPLRCVTNHFFAEAVGIRRAGGFDSGAQGGGRRGGGELQEDSGYRGCRLLASGHWCSLSRRSVLDLTSFR
jgi:hypothetical protein